MIISLAAVQRIFFSSPRSLRSLSSRRSPERSLLCCLYAIGGALVRQCSRRRRYSRRLSLVTIRYCRVLESTLGSHDATRFDYISRSTISSAPRLLLLSSLGVNCPAVTTTLSTIRSRKISPTKKRKTVSRWNFTTGRAPAAYFFSYYH